MDAQLFHCCLLEFLGTLILILMGDGVCAATALNRSKAQGGGWIVIALGWGLAVMCGVFVAHGSGAHLNPAVSLGLALAGLFDWSYVLPYCLAQLLGGFAGAILVYFFYKDHYDATPDGMTKLNTFCTMPAIQGHKLRNLFAEAVGTFVLVLLILCLSPSNYTSGTTVPVNLGGANAFPVTLIIVAIGMSLGGATGYAINPARDLAPRIAHAILPLKHKCDSGWSYSWVPVIGPLLGAAVAAYVGRLMGFC